MAVGEVGIGESAVVSMVDGLRVVTLDSLVSGQGDGLVTGEQLDWLAEVLSRPAPDGTLVALHHLPVHPAHHAAGRSVLERPEDLGRVLRGRDVHAVLCGHLHLQLSASLEGVPVLVAPGIVTRIDLSSDPRLVRGVRGAGAQVVDLGTPGSPTYFTVQARDPPDPAQPNLRQVHLIHAELHAELREQGFDVVHGHTAATYRVLVGLCSSRPLVVNELSMRVSGPSAGPLRTGRGDARLLKGRRLL